MKLYCINNIFERIYSQNIIPTYIEKECMRCRYTHYRYSPLNVPLIRAEATDSRDTNLHFMSSSILQLVPTNHTK